MDEYIPPLVAVTTGISVICLCFFMKIPFFLIGIISVFLVIYALRDHLMRFVLDYQHFSAPNFLRENASVLIITLVIILSLGYLLLRFGKKAVVTNQPTNISYGSDTAKSNWFSGLFKWKSNQAAAPAPAPAPRARYLSNNDYLSDPLSLIRRT